jgi:hypothetical protein
MPSWEKRGGFAGWVDHGSGKGDGRRPSSVEAQAFEQRGAETFGEEWLEPPVLRRKRLQEDPGTP